MQKINKLLLNMSIPVNIIILIGILIDFFRKAGSLTEVLATTIILVVSYTIQFLAYKHNPDGPSLRNVSMFIHILILSMLLVYGKCSSLYVLIFILSIVYILYFDLKLIITLGTCFNIINILSIVVVINRGNMLSGNAISNIHLIVQFLTVFIYFLLLVYTTHHSSSLFNQRKKKIIKNSKYSQGLIADIYRTVENIDVHSVKSNDCLNTLIDTSNNTQNIFKKMSNSNKLNDHYINQQKTLITNNTEKINNVFNMTNIGLDMTNTSIENLHNTTKAINKLKQKSNEIININADVIDKITKFVDNVNSVRNITTGIEDISFQTNLLSLNASIESSSAGEAGKGFAVVAGEIRKLVDKTIVLTNNINEVVVELKKEALVTQNVVNEIVEKVNMEDAIIDTINTYYQKLTNNINSLSTKVGNITSNYHTISQYNKDLKHNIKKLSDSSTYVDDTIQQIVDLSTSNAENITNAHDLIDELVTNINNLKETSNL